MTKLRKRPDYKAAIVFLASAILMMNCTRPEQDLGLDLQDSDRLLEALSVDTFTVRTYTLPEDSIRSDKFNPGMLGAYVDPIFGFAKAEHITELRMSEAEHIFVAPNTTLSDIVIDSLVLSLSFFSNVPIATASAGVGNFGPQYFKVHELLETLSIDGEYYHRRPVIFDEEDMVLPGQNFITPRPFDTLTINGVLAHPQLRIPLKTDFAQRIINFNGGTGLNQVEFLTLTNGLYLTVDETQFNPYASGIIYFNTFERDRTRARSTMTVYYRNTALGDTLSFDFLIRDNSGKFGRFTHGHELGAESLQAQVLQGIRDQGQRDLYIQAMGGTKIRLELPYIDALRELPNQAMNRAVLTLPVRAESIGDIPPPANLLIFGIRDDGSLFLLPDQLEGETAFIGGFYDPEKSEYQFRITRYLQQVISDNREFNGFEIVSGSAAFSARRVVINGPEYPDPASPSENAKLQIIFTKF